MKRMLTIAACSVLLSLRPTMAEASMSSFEETRAEPDAVTLVVTVDLGEDDHQIRDVVRQSVDSALVDAGVAVEEDATSVLVVEIRWNEGSKTDFAVTLRLGRDPSSIPSPLHSFRCDGCSAPQLLGRIEEEVTEVVPVALSKAIEEPDPEPAAQPEAVPDPVIPSGEANRSPKPRPNPRTLRNAGIATMLTGGVLMTSTFTLVGIWLVADREPVTPYELTLLGGGLAAVAAGGTMYGIAKVRERKPRATVRLSPSPRGIVLSGRF